VTVTQADRWGRQYQAAFELSRILLAHRELPVIAWTVSPSGCVLAGKITGSGPRQVRAVFASWQAALALDTDAERDAGNGAAHLSAAAYHGGVCVRLVATVYSYDEDDEHDGSADAAVTS
jgi:hypothetical protein